MNKVIYISYIPSKSTKITWYSFSCGDTGPVVRSCANGCVGSHSTVVCGALLELSEVVAGVSGVHSVLLPHLPLQHQPVASEDPISVLL